MYQNIVITDEVLVADEKGMVEIDFALDQDILLDSLGKLATTIAKNAKAQNSLDETLKSLKTFVDVNVAKLIRSSTTADEVMKRQAETVGKMQTELKMLGTFAIRRDEYEKFEKQASAKLKKCELFVDEAATYTNSTLAANMGRYLETYLPKWFEPQSVKMNKRIADELETKADQMRAASFLQMQQMGDKLLDQKHEIAQLRLLVEKLTATVESYQAGGGGGVGAAGAGGKGHPSAAERQSEAALASSATINHLQAKMGALDNLMRDMKARTDRIATLQDTMASAMGIKQKKPAQGIATLQAASILTTSVRMSGPASPRSTTAASPLNVPPPAPTHQHTVPRNQPLPEPDPMNRTLASHDVLLPQLKPGGDPDEGDHPDEMHGGPSHDVASNASSRMEMNDSMPRDDAGGSTTEEPPRQRRDRPRSQSPSKWSMIRRAVTPSAPATPTADGDDENDSQESEPPFVLKLREQLTTNDEVLLQKTRDLQEELNKFRVSFEAKIKEQLAEKVSLSTLKDQLLRNRDQALYANVTKCQSAIDELRKTKLESQDLAKMLQSKADKAQLESKLEANFFKATAEQTEFRLSELSAELRSVKVAAATAERNTNAAIRELKAGQPASGMGGGMFGAFPACGVPGIGAASPFDGGLYPPRPPGQGSVSFPSAGGLDPSGVRHDQSQRNLSPHRRSVVKRGAPADAVKKKMSDGPSAVDERAPTPEKPQSLPSLSHLLFKVDQEEYKTLKEKSEKEGKPLVTPRPPPED